jgi:hypothetical protein
MNHGMTSHDEDSKPCGPARRVAPAPQHLLRRPRKPSARLQDLAAIRWRLGL